VRALLAQKDRQLNFMSWTTWLNLGVGLLVTSLVFALLYWRYFGGRWSGGGAAAQALLEDDLPWEDLLHLLRERGRELAASGSPPEDDLPPEELLKLLLSRLPTVPARPAAPVPQEEVDFLASGNAERRTSRRRWGNPTEIFLNSPLWSGPRHGLVINRSGTGRAIFVDHELQQGTFLKVRSVEAPAYVPWVEIEVKNSRKAGRNFIIGCQFRQDVPWNVRVWFG